MTDEVQYASGADSASNKRKLDDGTTPPPPSSGARRTTGFSVLIASQSPDSSHAPSSYSSVPPLGDEIELAKQRAQEIAVRLFNNVESKRTRVENVGGGGYGSSDSTGFSSGPTGYSLKPTFSMTPSMPTSYGYPGASKKIEIPNARVGVIIGKAGETIKYLQLQSGAKIQITRDMEVDPNSPTRSVELIGTSEQIARAEQLINDVLAEAESGGSGIISRRITGQQGGAEQFIMKVPNNKVGLVIGKGGDTIKNMQATSGAHIQVIPLHLPPGDTSTERTVQIDGSSEQIEAAKQLVNEVISENRLRKPGMASGYPQQGYQAQLPTSWVPPVQQPVYGYVQPGAYPGPSPQQPYPSSYSQQQTLGGYPTSWDSPTVPQTQAGGYNNSYYNQQAPQQQQTPSGPTDSTTPYGGYNLGNYGGYPASASQSGGYGYNNSTPGYGNISNQTPGGQTPPPYNTTSSQQSSPNPNSSPSYPLQGMTQPGYVVPPTSQTSYGTQPSMVYGAGYGATQARKPHPQAGYGQPQQSPSGQGGYGYPYSQPPTDQSGYAHPPSSYGTVSAGPGYAPVQYGAQPTPYAAGSYGSGYSQPPPVYSGDGNARGANDSATSQTAQPAAVAKSSPQS